MHVDTISMELPILYFKGSLVKFSKLHRGSYMSVHVLLNLLNMLGKSDKMQGLPSIFTFLQRVQHIQ